MQASFERTSQFCSVYTSKQTSNCKIERWDLFDG